MGWDFWRRDLFQGTLKLLALPALHPHACCASAVVPFSVKRSLSADDVLQRKLLRFCVEDCCRSASKTVAVLR